MMKRGFEWASMMTMIAASLLYAINANPAYAQADGAPPSGAVTITSNPPGALVYLTGEYRFIGRTPFVLPYTLYGKYRIRANREGYESVTSQYNFTGEGNSSKLMIKLPARTRFKAFYRSMMLPGWGQYYSGRKSMGSILLGATTGAFVTLAIKEHSYKDAQTDYETARTKFSRAGSSFEEQREASNALQSALENLNDAEDARNTTLYIAGGLWLLNMIESVIFFPTHHQDIEFFQKLSPSVSHHAGEIKLSMQVPIR